MGKSTISMVIFHSYVSLPEGKPPFSYGFPMVFPCSYGFPYGFPWLSRSSHWSLPASCGNAMTFPRSWIKATSCSQSGAPWRRPRHRSAAWRPRRSPRSQRSCSASKTLNSPGKKEWKGWRWMKMDELASGFSWDPRWDFMGFYGGFSWDLMGFNGILWWFNGI